MGETEARRGRPLLPRKAARGRGMVPTLTAATAPLACAYRIPGLDFLPRPEPPSPPRPAPQHGQSPRHPSLTVFPPPGTPHTCPFLPGSFHTQGHPGDAFGESVLPEQWDPDNPPELWQAVPRPELCSHRETRGSGGRLRHQVGAGKTPGPSCCVLPPSSLPVSPTLPV